MSRAENAQPSHLLEGLQLVTEIVVAQSEGIFIDENGDEINRSGRKLPSQRSHSGLAWRHFHQTSKFTQRTYCQLLITLRAELAEITDWFHFHYLLGRTRSHNLITLAHQLGHQWKDSTGGAISQIRLFDGS